MKCFKYFGAFCSLLAMTISGWNLMLINSRNKANMEGQRAFYEGKMLDNNPHTSEDLKVFWTLGWYGEANKPIK